MRRAVLEAAGPVARTRERLTTQHRCRVVVSASIADFRGRYPYESGWNCGSTSGSRYILTTVWAILSATVGMPKRRSLPSFFGIPTDRTYVPDDIRFQIL